MCSSDLKMAYPGDSIDLGYATTNTRRGRVGRGIAHTLTTGSRQGTLHFVDLSPPPVVTETARCLHTRQDASVFRHKGETSGVLCHGRIRRLTPRECLRLQGYRDDQIDKMTEDMSDSQLYKQAGNGVTVTVIEAIGRNLSAVHEELKGQGKDGSDAG